MMIFRSPAQPCIQGHDQENEPTVSELTVSESSVSDSIASERDMPEGDVREGDVPMRAGVVARPVWFASRSRVVGGRQLSVLSLAAVFAVAACGGGSGAAATTVAGPIQNRGTNSTPSGPPGVTGTAAAVTDTAIQVQNPSVGQVTVNFNSSTAFTQTEQTTASSLVVGDCVVVTAAAGTGASQAAATDGPIAAQNIMISKPDAGGCTANGAFRGAFGGGARPSGAPNPSGSPRPQRSPGAGGQGRFGAVIGTVTSKSDTTFVVTTIARGDSPATTRTVTTSASTGYDQTVPASSAALKVGECVTAVGPADSTGAVTATSISIRQAGSDGCTSGFRQPTNVEGSANG